MERVVIVTGAAGGLGSETARRFGETGAKVVVGYAKSHEAAEVLSREINEGPGKSFAHRADVRIYEEMKGMVDETVKRWGRIDVVVNAAGGPLALLTRKENKLLLDHSEEEWDLVVDVNLKGTFNCIKTVAPQMIKQGDGNIILISSGTGIRPGKLMSSYAAAKAGVFGLMKAAARELGEYNIKINAVNPGFVIHKSMVIGGVNVESAVAERVLGRLLNAEDLAEFVVYLSQKNNISGQTFNLDSKILF